MLCVINIVVLSLVASNKRLFFIPLGPYKQQQFSRSSDPRYSELGSRFIFPKDWDEFHEFMKRVVNEDSDAISINLELKKKEKKLGAWYRSSEPIRSPISI